MGVIVFGGGAELRVGPDAERLAAILGSATQPGEIQARASARQGPFVLLDSDLGPVYVNPFAVAYTRDDSDMGQVEETPGTLSGLEPRQVRGNP